jgi:hypothetical protein
MRNICLRRVGFGPPYRFFNSQGGGGFSEVMLPYRRTEAGCLPFVDSLRILYRFWRGEGFPANC